MPTRAWACHPAPMGQGERGYATRLPEGAAPSPSFRATRCEAERSTADRGTRSSASRSDTADAVAAWRRMPCGKLFERIPPLRAFGPPVGMTMVGVYKVVGWHGRARRGHGTTNAPLHRQDMPIRRRRTRGGWACHPATKARPSGQDDGQGGACKNVGWAVSRGPRGLPQRAQRAQRQPE